VQELSRYRSEFFGRLRAILGTRPDIRVVGDPLRVPVRGVFRHRTGATAAGRPRRARQARERLIDIDKQIRRDRLGCCGSTATPTAARSRARSSVELGIVVGARDLRGAVPDLARRGAGAAAWWPRASPNSSRVDPEKNEDAYRRNRRIELKADGAMT